MTICSASSFFFFQAEDGIRDLYVTGVQTCALPIFHRRGSARARRLDARLAHHAPEPHRRAPGRGRSRPGGALRRVRRQRRDRRRHPDFHCRHRVRDVGVQRDGCAGRPLRRGQRTRQGESHCLPGIPRRGGVVGIAAGPAGVGPGAVAARRGERRARRAGRGPAVPAYHVRWQPWDAALLHGERGPAGGGRRAHAAAPRCPPHCSEHRVQRGVHYGPRAPAPAGHRRRRRRHHGGGDRRERHRGIHAALRAAPGDVAPRHELATRLAHHPRAVPLHRPGGRRPGRAATRLPQCFGVVRHRRPHVHRGTPGHGRHPVTAVHLNCITDRGAARALRPVPGDARPAPRRHLDGHPAGAHHALCVERAAVPSGKVARDQGGGRARVSGPKATRRDWIGLAVIALPCLLYSMDLTVLNLAVPKLSAALKPSSAQLLWIVDIYGFLIAGSLITMGTLGDRIGRRRLLLIGAAAFGVASVIAAFSTTAEMLIATRALLGVAGATLAPSTLSLIRNMFLDPQQRTVAIGVWVTSYSVGGAIGPLLGGVLLQYFWWRSVFLIGVPVMLLLLVLGPVLLPEFRDPAAERLDLSSAALSLVAVLLVIYGLKRIAEHGLAVVPALTMVTGLVVGIVFLRRQRLLAHPLIDLHLFRSRAFSASLGVYLLATLVAFGAYIFIAQYLQLVLGLSPLKAGLATVPSMAAFIVGSMVVPVLARRVRPWSLIGVGLVVGAVGFGVLTQVDGATGLGAIVIGSVIYSLGLSPVVVLATDLIVGSAPVERAGAASAISETSSELGGALGIAVLGSIGVAVYRGMMATGIPMGVPPEAAEVARATLGGALSVAQQLPHHLRVELLDTARDAFAQSVRLTAAISAVISLTMAIIVRVSLRQRTSS